MDPLDRKSELCSAKKKILDGSRIDQNNNNKKTVQAVQKSRTRVEKIAGG